MRVKKRQALGLAMNMSWTMLFSLMIPLLAGLWLDKQLGTAPLFILIGAVLGISAATIGVARMTIRSFGKTSETLDRVEEAATPGPSPSLSDQAARPDQQIEANDKEAPE